MSRTTVLAYAKGVCQGITGVVNCTVGKPNQEPLPEAGLPWILLGAPQPKWTPVTLDANGQGLVHSKYPVNIVVVMGPKNMAPDDAEAARDIWSQRIHQAFSADPKLGGLVWSAELTDGIDNVDTYRAAGREQLPQAAYRLMVEEEIARNAVAD